MTFKSNIKTPKKKISLKTKRITVKGKPTITTRSPVQDYSPEALQKKYGGASPFSQYGDYQMSGDNPLTVVNNFITSISKKETWLNIVALLSGVGIVFLAGNYIIRTEGTKLASRVVPQANTRPSKVRLPKT